VPLTTSAVLVLIAVCVSAPAAPVTSFITNGTIALSGCSNGVIKLWRMADGQLASEAAEPAEVAITAMTFVSSYLVSSRSGLHASAVATTKAAGLAAAS
jgi:hypothetical protein